jgi:hypothetical protein
MLQEVTEFPITLVMNAYASMPIGLGVGVGLGVGTGVGRGTGEVTGGRFETPSPPGTVLNVGDKVGEEGSGLGLVGVGLEGLEGVGLEGVGLGEGESGVGKVLSGTGTSPRSTASGVTVEELKED